MRTGKLERLAAGLVSVAVFALAACGNSISPNPSGGSAGGDSGVDGGSSSFPKIKAGVAVVDDTWQVGACAGQYCADNPVTLGLISALEDQDPGEIEPGNPLAAPTDPFFYHRLKDASYGVQSRLSARALVIEGSNGKRVALVKTDNYLAQDMLMRRVGQLLDADGTSGIHYDDILYHVTHDHSSPYYATLSWGVWLFQDVYDQRAFEFQARKIAQAIEEAAANLKPARLGATVVRHTLYKGNIVRTARADDGTPAGYPLEYNDHQLTLLRFDDLSDPAQPKPLALWANWGEHPESLDGYGLHSADFLGPLERWVQRETGAVLVWSQGDVGSSESSGNPVQLLDDRGKVCGQWPEDAQAPASDQCPAGQGALRDWEHQGYAQTERNARYLADAIRQGFEQIGAADPSVVVPYTSDFVVDRVNAWVPGPVSHPYPSVSNCRTDPTLGGDPGVPVLGLPDCARFSSYFPSEVTEGLLPVFANLEQLAALAQGAGVPIPDHYDFIGFTGVEENLRLKLQVFRLGEIVLASCACEAQNDLILNLKSRLDAQAGNIYDGFDWACLMPGFAAEPVCERQRQYYDPDEFPTAIPGDNFDEAAIAHLRAQVHNDARGWDDPVNAVAANSEPPDVTKIWGNFTKEEIQDLGVPGYKLAVGVGHAGDYNGYTVSYREYMNRDSYRKALTSYGPHTADYMVTRLVRMAAALQGAPPLAAELLAPIGTVDEARQAAMAEVLGPVTSAAYDLWLASLPDDPGPARALTQPQDLEHFNATTFTWVGGSNAEDNPIARVEREVAPGRWEPFADGSGEVQTMVEFPLGLTGALNSALGAYEWHWTANFEAYAAHPARLGSTPPGRYRFVVDGQIRQNGAAAPYHLESEPFTVRPWGGLAVRNIAVDGAGNLGFEFTPIEYPRSYESPFKFVRDDGGQRICKTCSFRPWARTGAPASAKVTVKRASGALETFTASASGANWSASTALAGGDEAYIAAGDLRDSNGETNRAVLPLR